MRKMYNQFRVGHDHTCLGYVCVSIYMYVWVFYNLFFTPLVKGGIFALGPGVSKHTTTDTESWDLTEFIRHINTAQGRRILYPLQDHTGSSEFAPSRAVWTSTECRGASSVVKKTGWGDSWFLWEDVIGWFEQSCHLSGNWNLLGWGWGEVKLILLIKGLPYWVKDLVKAVGLTDRPLGYYGAQRFQGSMQHFRRSSTVAGVGLMRW